MGTAGMSMNHCGVLVSPLHTVVNNRHHFLYSSNGSEERNSHLRAKPVTYGPKPIRKCVRILRMLTLPYWLRMLKKGKISWQWRSYESSLLWSSSLSQVFMIPVYLQVHVILLNYDKNKARHSSALVLRMLQVCKHCNSQIVNACILSRLYLVTRDGISVAPSLLVTISSC